MKKTSALVAFSVLLACRIPDELHYTTDMLGGAVDILAGESAAWRAELSGALRALEDDFAALPREVQQMMRAEVTQTIQRAVAGAGSEVRCDADFLRARLIADINRIRARVNDEVIVDAPSPTLCTVVPLVIESTLDVERRSYVQFYGYDLRSSDISVWVVRGTEGARSEISDSLSVTSDYQMSLDISNLRMFARPGGQGPHVPGEGLWPDAPCRPGVPCGPGGVPERFDRLERPERPELPCRPGLPCDSERPDHNGGPDTPDHDGSSDIPCRPGFPCDDKPGLASGEASKIELWWDGELQSQIPIVHTPTSDDGPSKCKTMSESVETFSEVLNVMHTTGDTKIGYKKTTRVELHSEVKVDKERLLLSASAKFMEWENGKPHPSGTAGEGILNKKEIYSAPEGWEIRAISIDPEVTETKYTHGYDTYTFTNNSGVVATWWVVGNSKFDDFGDDAPSASFLTRSFEVTLEQCE